MMLILCRPVIVNYADGGPPGRGFHQGNHPAADRGKYFARVDDLNRNIEHHLHLFRLISVYSKSALLIISKKSLCVSVSRHRKVFYNYTGFVHLRVHQYASSGKSVFITILRHERRLLIDHLRRNTFPSGLAIVKVFKAATTERSLQGAATIIGHLTVSGGIAAFSENFTRFNL
ncbi:hypothetical protein DJICPGNB_07910 [Escherichia coli]|nr:hypothetical protein DJICPGNB_07910 [Escherichia coli]